MSSTQRLSPRQEALNAILDTHGLLHDSVLTAAAWEKLVAIAWDNRTHVGDRRDIRREVKSILLEAARPGGES